MNSPAGSPASEPELCVPLLVSEMYSVLALLVYAVVLVPTKARTAVMVAVLVA